MATTTAIYSEIERFLGEAARKYAENKQRGGSNGKKGTRYEDYFIAFKAAEIAARLIDTPNPAWPTLRSQVVGFVDDAVVEALDSTQYFQLKNVKSINWTGGDHPLETDFKYQFDLASFLSQPSPTMGLVVSSNELQASLSAEMPESIAKHSSVMHFPYCEALNRYVLEHTELQEYLKVLAKSEDPTFDELTGVFGVLIVALFSFPDGGRVDEILEATRKSFPHQVRSLVSDMKQYLKPDFEAVLAGIQGLSYAVVRGYFRWEGFGTTGIFRVDCKHDDFQEFQRKVIASHPKTFDDFEGQLA
jgi:hypothetical protein